jgi:hypothetical protein
MLLSGRIGDHIWHEGAGLLQFSREIVLLVVVFALLAYVPLTFFSKALVRTGFVGGHEYGLLRSRYVRRFRNRWIARPTEKDLEALLGTGDIQSLADLANSFEVVEGMRVVPFGLQDVVKFALLLVAPLLPLGLTIISIDEVIKDLLRLVVADSASLSLQTRSSSRS